MKEKMIAAIPPNIRHKLPFFNQIRHLYMRKIYNKYNYNYESEIRSLKDIHPGERCFLIGTGPSLNETPLHLIKDEIAFGTNTLYKLLPKLDVRPLYYCVSDGNVWNDHKEGILKLDTTLILSGDAGRSYLQENERQHNVIVLKDLGSIQRSRWQEKDITKGTYWGYSVMIDTCLQVAFYMGFKTVSLLGCDCDYSGKYHFDNEKYDFQKVSLDKHWDNAFASYEIIKEGYEENGKKIYNATVKSKLDVFERKKLEDIFQ